MPPLLDLRAGARVWVKGCPFRCPFGARWLSPVDDLAPPGRPGIETHLLFDQNHQKGHLWVSVLFLRTPCRFWLQRGRKKKKRREKSGWVPYFETHPGTQVATSYGQSVKSGAHRSSKRESAAKAPKEQTTLLRKYPSTFAT